MEINIIISSLANWYKIEDLGSYRQFTEIRLNQNFEKKTISLSQRVYIKNVLKYTDILNYKLVFTPIFSRINFWKNINKLINEKFVCFYQFHIDIYI